ncbi:MFS general substrate transporter [Purpureocillium lavendulum]|uniref:MFS general substrate transporter n=1 Tax=Purpureocillium lavendulum TaxID=1247861 RepID=A0AB34FQT2_9HYPO|nr:MFS general substrate transporter [Purpureocillium lavendulum]
MSKVEGNAVLVREEPLRARTLITSRYRDGLEARKSNPDQVFYDAEDLAELDASTIFAPSLQSMMEDVGETDPVKGALQIAIFLLSFAIAPIFLAPLSEIHGRRPILRWGNMVFAAFGIGAGFSKTTAQLSACRFLAGVGGSSSMAVFGGVLSDIWSLRDRAKASAILGTAL